MSQPSATDIQVATGALRTEAKIWGSESTACTNLGKVVEGLSMTDLEGGLLYGLYVSKYQEVCEFMTKVLEEGGQEMASISDTLVASADTYDREEAENVHLAQGKW